MPRDGGWSTRSETPGFPNNEAEEMEAFIMRCEINVARMRKELAEGSYGNVADTAQELRRSAGVVQEAARAVSVRLVAEKGSVGRMHERGRS